MILLKTEYRKKGIAPLITAAVAVVVFTLALALAITTIGSAEGNVKTAREAPDSLVSAGAPRSQLELKRMFESMSLSYTENGKMIYEPISAEYKRSVNENSVLAIEEVLFIISDSVAAYEKYDVIRFRDADGNIDCEIVPFEPYQSEDLPFHRSAYERIYAAYELIKLRIEYMSGEGAMVEIEKDLFRYAPRQVERSKNKEKYENDRAFLFVNGTISFEAEKGREVVLYPTEKDMATCKTKVIAVLDTEISESERNTLSAFGYDAARCRNITPEYWYGETDVRLFVFGGRVILVDVDKAFEPFAQGDKLDSAAMLLEDLYFTVSSEKGSSVWKYSDSKMTKILETEDEHLAVIEPIVSEKYDSVEVYAAMPHEDGRFVTALECKGDAIAKYFAE